MSKFNLNKSSAVAKVNGRFFGKKRTAAFITTILIAATAMLLCTACSGGTKARLITDGASLILSPDNLTINVTAITENGFAVTVEGCTEKTLASGTETTLHAQGTAVILKGKITALYCQDNQLTALNVQGLNALQGLDCNDNQLTELNTQGLSALQWLFCQGNQLTELNAQGCPALQWLWCYDNRLTTLNVQNLSALQELFCQGNQLTELDVQGCTALHELNCNNNQLTTLNVQECSTLRRLSCGNNKLTALNVQGLNALQVLSCGNNRLTFLNVQGCTALHELECEHNQLTSLNVQGCTALRSLDCSNNQLSAQALTSLLTGLPAQSPSDNAKCILYTESSGEGTLMDFTASAELYAVFQNAKTKNWRLYCITGNSDGNDVEL